MIIASIFAIASLVYIVVDIIIEKRQKEEPQEEEIEECLPVVEEKTEPEVLPAAVAYIDAEEADAMISDSLAMKNASYEGGAGQGMQAIINVGVINNHFEANDVITISVLKQKGLINKKAGRIKVLADGILEKALTIKAESYSVQAIKMIELTGGSVIILKD
jgi:ribosomal protein L18E